MRSIPDLLPEMHTQMRGLHPGYSLLLLTVPHDQHFHRTCLRLLSATGRQTWAGLQNNCRSPVQRDLRIEQTSLAACKPALEGI